MKRLYTRDELDVMAGRFFDRVHRDVPHEPWSGVPDYRRFNWRQAVLELLDAKEDIDTGQQRVYNAAHRRTIKLTSTG